MYYTSTFQTTEMWYSVSSENLTKKLGTKYFASVVPDCECITTKMLL